jgi:hypothetical protein
VNGVSFSIDSLFKSTFGLIGFSMPKTESQQNNQAFSVPVLEQDQFDYISTAGIPVWDKFIFDKLIGCSCLKLNRPILGL